MTVQSLMLVIPVIALAIGGAVYGMAALEERRQARVEPAETKKGVLAQLSETAEHLNSLLRRHPSL